MPRIHCVEDDEATGKLAEIYQHWKSANPNRSAMPDILKCFSGRPDILQPLMQYTYGLHFADGFLTRRIKEMLATYVSALNQCEY